MSTPENKPKESKSPSREVLEDLCIKQNKSSYEIGEMYKVHGSTVRKWMRKYKIQRERSPNRRLIEAPTNRVPIEVPTNSAPIVMHSEYSTPTRDHTARKAVLGSKLPPVKKNTGSRTIHWLDRLYS